MDGSSSSPPLIDAVTIGSFLLVVVLLALAYALSLSLLPSATSTKTRSIFIWHLFNSLIHFVLEGSFLYYSFLGSAATPLHGASQHVLWGDEARSYGVAHSDALLARLWHEYAKADLRWGRADVGVMAVELVTVFGGGPLAMWICELVRRGDERAWFWIVVLATAELYGGYMTFVPEWLTGSQNLMTDNIMYKWVYLFFFNSLWVWIPLWLLYEAYCTILPALKLQTMVAKVAGTAGVLGGATFGEESDSEGECKGK